MKAERRGIVETLGDTTSKLAGRLMPEPFVLAVVLTVLVIVVALLGGESLEGLSLGDKVAKVVVEGWAGGLFGKNGLTFAFQMIMVLVTGYAFARSRPIQRFIDLLASVPQSAGQASAVVALASCVSGYIHWGLGAVAGAMLAREIGRSWAERKKPLHYPLLGAAAYSGLLVWHGGLSGSAPLKIAEKGHFLEDVTGVIPVDQTLFGATNLVIVAALMATTTLLYFFLTPRSAEDMVPFRGPLRAAASRSAGEDRAEESEQFAAIRFLDRSSFVPWVLGGLGLGYLAYAFVQSGFKALNLNTVNLAFFSLGLVLHGSTRSYVEAASQGARGAVGIILQFPLYFGLLGVLKASGLIAQLSDFFVAISSATTLPIFTFLSAGLVNLFVPSGGGQWAVQGPVIMKAAESLGADPGKVVVALAHGDAWTNMLQPFWALPLLGIMGLRARDIVGYTTLLCLVSFPVVVFCLLVL